MKCPEVGEIYLTIEGEGSCDQCGKEIAGDIIHFEKSGDYCESCFKFVQQLMFTEAKKGKK